MNLDERIKNILADQANSKEGKESDTEDVVSHLEPEALSKVLSTWIDLQNAVNGYIDSRLVVADQPKCV